MLLVTGAAQGLEKRSLAELCRRFGVSRRTVKRWLRFFAVVFPSSRRWQGLRGRVGPWVDNAELPTALLVHFFAVSDSLEAGLVGCLVFLADGDGSCSVRGERAHAQDAQIPRSER